ncbi:hypothetical protein D3C86_1755430 [compost metagenome]
MPVRPDELLSAAVALVVGTRFDILARKRNAQVFGQVVARVNAEVITVEIIVIHNARLVHAAQAEAEVTFVITTIERNAICSSTTSIPVLVPVVGLRSQWCNIVTRPPLSHQAPVHRSSPAFVGSL